MKFNFIENVAHFMTEDLDYFEFENEALCLKACKVAWDSDILGVPVGNIIKIELKEKRSVQREFHLFKTWVHDNGYGMISCRLPHQKLLESTLLERNDFRFIEVVLHPTLNNLQDFVIYEHNLSVGSVEKTEISLIGDIAACAFGYERFHMDPLLHPKFGDKRYRRWAENSYGDQKQNLLKVTMRDKIVGFFLVEYKDDLVYWHLTAVDPVFHGQGYGYRVWMAMLGYHKQEGVHRILTTISARNIPVLNLYSKLNFRFLPPEMTFHWVGDIPSNDLLLTKSVT